MDARAFLRSLPIPIIQAPMLGASSPAMSLGGEPRPAALGRWRAAGWSPDEIESQIAEAKAAGLPFAANFFVLETARPAPGEVDAALARLAPWYAALGAPVPEAPNTFAPDFEAQFGALLKAAPPAASFTFSILTGDQVEALHVRDVLVIGTPTTVGEARAWADVGADAICAQGAEAGGHRGSFLAPVEESLIGTMALVPTIRQATGLPVIAAGGIMDGAGVAAALALGAVAAQMGTAFLLANDRVTSAPWREAAIEGGRRYDPPDPRLLGPLCAGHPRTTSCGRCGEVGRGGSPRLSDPGHG